MSSSNASASYLLHLADTSLILAQRNAEWCGHGPILEQDIAITNITLDLVGQARMYYQQAANLINAAENKNETEDSLAFLRDERAFKNYLICELPNGDWAQTILRQFFYSSFQILLLEKLSTHQNSELAAIAVKSLKEVQYHVKWSSEWVIRLGDGTEESSKRMNDAIEKLWAYTGEFFILEDFEENWVSNLKDAWTNNVQLIFDEAKLTIPLNVFMQTGGKKGVHTEHFGYVLAEMQTLQRSFPGANW
jgi:ring-1,2-phenylacetyl-CoA epoxidase subunit PaaC